MPKLTPEELNKVSVKLAPPATFKEFGLDRASVLGNLVFSIEYNAEGDVYVRVVSTQPIREPSLGLLLEFGWPRGKTFREFTVLLDPVQRLAKRSSDRTKTVLEASGGATTEPITASAPTAQPSQPALAAPAATAPAAATPPAAAPITAAAVPSSAPTSATTAPAAAVAPSPTVAAAPIASVVPPPAPSSAAVAPVAPDATVPPPPAPVAPDAAVPVVTVPAPVVPVSIPTPTTLLPPPVSPAPAGVAVAASGPSQSPPAAATLPVEAKPAPVKVLKGEDSYGPVAAGEKLWKIAVKVRPDPDITPEQMMQALYKANPHAFAKSGIDGLKVGSTLRVPTFREIAKFTGSVAAKRLADTEDMAMAMLVETARPRVEPTGAGTVDGSQVKAEGPTVFPLAMPENLEPMVTALAPAETVLAVLAPQLAKVEAAPDMAAIGSTAEVMEAPVGGATDQPKGATAIEPSRAGPEPAKMPAPITPPGSGSAAKPAVAARAVSPPLLEPIAATLLPFTAVSEVMASVAKIPAFALPAQIVPGAIIADVPAPSAQKIPAIGAVPPVALTRRDHRALAGSESEAIEPVAITGQRAEPPEASGQTPIAADPNAPKPSTASPSTTDLLAAIEEPVRRVESASVDLVPYSARATIERAPPPAPALAGESRQELPQSPSATTVDSADDERGEKTPANAVSSPAVETLPAAVVPLVGEAAAIPPADTLEPAAEPRHQSGVRYGPVAPNERLWDIATKVRPDPSIGKDIMMKALHMANPQAFSKTGINQMKAGVTLRIPTLQEIADYTGSAAAKQLLEQQTKAMMPSPPEPKTSSESISRTEADSMPVAESDAGSKPEAESGSKPSPQPAQPVADTPALSATPSAD